MNLQTFLLILPDQQQLLHQYKPKKYNNAIENDTKLIVNKSRALRMKVGQR